MRILTLALLFLLICSQAFSLAPETQVKFLGNLSDGSVYEGLARHQLTEDIEFVEHEEMKLWTSIKPAPYKMKTNKLYLVTQWMEEHFLLYIAYIFLFSFIISLVFILGVGLSPFYPTFTFIMLFPLLILIPSFTDFNEYTKKEIQKREKNTDIRNKKYNVLSEYEIVNHPRYGDIRLLTAQKYAENYTFDQRLYDLLKVGKSSFNKSSYAALTMGRSA